MGLIDWEAQGRRKETGGGSAGLSAGIETREPSGLTPSTLKLPRRFKNFRRGQDWAILDAASSPLRFQALCAPPGTGKTAINVGIAKLTSARVLYLVGTKALQDQVTDEFREIGAMLVKGRVNYSCIEGGTCDEGAAEGCTADSNSATCGGPEDCSCPYRAAVAAAWGTDIVVANYAYWMALARFGNRHDELGRFDLVVGDEAHTIEAWLTSLMTVEIKVDDVTRFMEGIRPDTPGLDESIERKVWARAAGEKIKAHIKEAGGGFERSKEGQRLSTLARGLLTVAGSQTAWAARADDAPYGIGISKAVVGWSLSPVSVAEFAEHYLFRGIEKVVLTSATITPHAVERLGVGRGEMRYAEIGSGFEPKRRPLIYIPTVRVDYRMSEGHSRILARRVDEIIAGRLDRKGVIHTKSYARASEIVARSQYSGMMVTHAPGGTRRAIEEFKRSRGGRILVSPAVEEGFDFPHDDARYQIILKIPFVDGRGQLEKWRKKADGRYMSELAAQALIQTVGRSTRAETDWSECVAPETKVLTEDLRWVRADSVRQGDRLLTVEEHARIVGIRAPGTRARRRWTWSVVEKSVVRTMPRMRVVLDDREVICTPNHPWLVFGRGAQHARMLIWRRTDELSSDDQLVEALPVWNDAESRDLGYLGGFADGEGCLVVGHGARNSAVTGLVLSQNSGSVSSEVQRLLSKHRYEPALTIRKRKSNMTADGHVIRIGGGFQNVLRFLGETRPLRLLGKFQQTARIEQFLKRGLRAVVRVERLPDGPICSLQTSSKTFLAEGLVAHNSFILDDHWVWFSRSADFPHWFQAGWCRMEEVPPAMAPIQ